MALKFHSQDHKKERKKEKRRGKERRGEERRGEWGGKGKKDLYFTDEETEEQDRVFM
jgi:hypothetical protein